jgi:hypothetical protein
LTDARERTSFVVRPNVRQYLARLGARRGAPLALAIIGSNTLAVANQGRSALLALVVLEVVLALVGIALGIRFFRRASIFVGNDDVTITGAWRRPLIVPREYVRGASARSIRRRQGGTNDVLILYGVDHQTIKVLNRLVWADDDLLRLKGEFGRSSSKTLVSSPKTPVQLEAEFPGATRSWDRHPWVAALGLVIVGLAIVSTVLFVADPNLVKR